MSILRGDCIEVMRTLDADSIDAIVTDPPYGIEFMGKEWDKFSAKVERDATSTAKYPGQGKHFTTAEGSGIGVGGPRFTTQTAKDAQAFEEWCRDWGTEALRVLRPGGHILAFGGTRMYHRLVSGLEDAGFEIRDQLMWIYASGFPKSLDVSKAIDKAAGAEREVVGRSPHYANRTFLAPPIGTFVKTQDERAITAPATDAAREWQGWGTALKPAHEPIVLARKPLVGTVAANVQAHGTGALNIDGCRIGTEETLGRTNNDRSHYSPTSYSMATDERTRYESSDLRGGRWPANVVLTDPVFDGGWEGVVGGGETGGGSFSFSGKRAQRDSPVYGWATETRQSPDNYGDTGTYSRFFLVPKAPRRERVLRDGRRSPHPTQKPEQLIRHLVTMVTPPGGIVLDPFLGSGTLGVVCEDIGVRWLGIEREAEYAEWARDRLADRQPEWVKAEEEMC